MRKIIALEGLDYSGKTHTLANLPECLTERRGIFVNSGPVYKTDLTHRLISLAAETDDLERERVYTLIMALDKISDLVNSSTVEEIYLQDRYWPSVVAYGRFLNGCNSIHCDQDLSNLFIKPVATVVLSCSREEMTRRSARRGRKSVLDETLLSNPQEVDKLEAEMEFVLKNLSNVYRIDTTNLSVEEVGDKLERFLRGLNLL
jgi:thymidylate kinase